jgi:hypothetical protein
MTTIIYLDCKALGVSERPFSVTHAEALLNYQKQKGFTDWSLSPNQDYTFKDGAIVITSTGADQTPAKRKRVTGREGA